MTDEAVRVSTLPNGLRVVTETSDRVESVAVGVWVGAGTRHEAAEINGVSHLLEHMAFKGTERRSARDIAEEVEDVGGHINAYTSRECTAYHIQVLKEDLPLSIDILSDILLHSTFQEDELVRERAVVLQEIGQAEDTPDDIIFDHFQQTAFPDQPLGRPVLGTEAVVSDMSRATLRTYMNSHYTAPGMVLSASGNFDHDALLDLAGEKFSALPGGASLPFAPAAYKGGDCREIRDLEQVHLVLGLPGLGFSDPDYDALMAFTTLLGGGMSSRLFQEIREKRGLAYSIYSFAASYLDGGLFGVYAGTGEADLPELVHVLCDQIIEVASTVTEAELRRTKAQLKAGTVMSLESTSSRCEQLARQMLIFGRPLPLSELVSRIEAVDLKAVARVAGRLIEGPPTLAAMGPAGRLPAYESIAKRLV